jgi:hypothetical protein
MHPLVISRARIDMGAASWGYSAGYSGAKALSSPSSSVPGVRPAFI